MSKRAGAVMLALMVPVMFLLTTVFFSPDQIFNSSPIFDDDYSLHYSQCLAAKYFLTQYGKCWGYDPFLLAGFPNGALANADNKAWEVLLTLISPVTGNGRAFKLYVLLFLLSYPFFIYGAGRNFNLSREQSLTAACISIIFFHLSIAIDFVQWGMISYVFCCFFGLYVLSLFYKLLGNFTWKRYAGIVILTALLLMMHILSVLPVFIPFAVLYAWNFRRLSVQHHLLLLIMAAAAIAVNSFWLIPVAQFMHIKTTNPAYWNFSLQITDMLEPIRFYCGQERGFTSSFYKPPVFENNTFIDTFLLLFGGCGLYLWYRKKQYSLCAAFLGGLLFLFAVAYYGSFTDFFAQLQPERFRLTLSLLLIIPAGAGLLFAGREIAGGRSVLTLFFVFCVAAVLWYRPVIKPLGIMFAARPYRLSCVFPERLQALLRFIEHNTTREGRILIEDAESCGEYPKHIYEGHITALFPEYVRREYLLGPRPMYPIQHSHASFTMGVLFEKAVAAYTLNDLQRAFDVYNVKWIVCWYPKSKEYFNRFPGYIVKLSDIDNFTVYEVKRNPSFFLKGRGKVSADYNRLELKDLQPDDHEVIIAYHWMEKLKTVPEARIERVYLAGDPVGFIRIKNPPQSLTVVNGY